MSVGITADAYAQAYPFHLACKQGNDKIIMKYMGSKKLSTNLNKPDHLGRTPLIVAAAASQIGVLRLFFEKYRASLNLNSPDNHGYTALLAAVEANALEIAEFLISSGVDARSATNDGYTALHFLAISSAISLQATARLFDKLLFNGCSLNAQNKDGETPLHLAARKGRTRFLEQCIPHKPNLALKDKAGDTVLQVAACSPDFTNLAIFARCPSLDVAAVSVVNAAGLTLRDIVLRTNVPDLIKFLDENFPLPKAQPPPSPSPSSSSPSSSSASPGAILDSWGQLARQASSTSNVAQPFVQPMASMAGMMMMPNGMLVPVAAVQMLPSPSSFQQQPVVAMAPPPQPAVTIGIDGLPAPRDVIALYDYTGSSGDVLSFKVGDRINLKTVRSAEWAEGYLHGKLGVFPLPYIRELTPAEASPSGGHMHAVPSSSTPSSPSSSANTTPNNSTHERSGCDTTIRIDAMHLAAAVHDTEDSEDGSRSLSDDDVGEVSVAAWASKLSTSSISDLAPMRGPSSSSSSSASAHVAPSSSTDDAHLDDMTGEESSSSSMTDSGAISDWDVKTETVRKARVDLQEKANITVKGNIWQAYSPAGQTIGAAPAQKSGMLIDKGIIRGASIDCLINALFDSSLHTAKFTETFILTYTSFTNPSEILYLVEQAYLNSAHIDATSQEGRVYRLRTVNFLKNWILAAMGEFRPEDFISLDRFVNVVLRPLEGEKTVTLIKRSLDKRNCRRAPTLSSFSTPPPPPVIPRRAPFSFLELDPGELARQLTIHESLAYREIEPVELLGLGWTKPDKNDRSPKVLQFIRSFNRVCNFFATVILSESDIKQRALTIESIIACAEHLREMNNFNGLMEALTGLTIISVSRLSKTWAKVSKIKQKSLSSLREILDSNSNYGNYRSALNSVNPPVVPFVGMYLTDLVYIEEGNPDFIREEPSYINFHKRFLVAKVIDELYEWKKVPYNLVSVNIIQTYLEQFTPMNDEAQYAQSLKLEPRKS